ncbi:hypothetical protein FACS1894219_09100 [Clostridia bacterium]|nr:hypothetical protein FACS1894219_09100 [Clostridia bacterium]
MSISAVSSYSSATSVTSAATKLTSAEEEYDYNGDGVLSVAEKAAYKSAQQTSLLQNVQQQSNQANAYEREPVKIKISEEGQAYLRSLAQS